MTNVITDRGGKNMLLAAAALAMFMDGLDGSIVNVTLPTISRSFGGDAGSVSWVITIYFLMMAGLILIFGKISDGGAIKKVFTVGFLIFSLSSLACGLSTGLEALLVSRAIQGVGAAMLAASALMLCVKYYPPGRLGFALSIVMLGMTVGAAMGPALGGFLVHLTSWHWIFFINVPIGLIAIAFALRAIPADEGLEKTSFDIKGSVLLFITLASGLYLVEAAPSAGAGGLTAPAASVFVASLVLFIITSRRSPVPVLNLELFRFKGFVATLLSFVLINACFMGALYLVPFYLDLGMGFNPMTSGLFLLIPSAVIFPLSARLGRLSDRTERRAFVVAACAMMAVFMIIYSMMTPEMGYAPLIIALVSMGLVWAIGGGAATSRIVENVPKSESGSASSLMSFTMYFGSALGTVLFAAFFGAGAGSKGVEFSQMTLTTFLDGFHLAMIIGLMLSLIALVLAASVNEKKRHGSVVEAAASCDPD
ncbi:MAG: DHA2 family efflux MFS transporter permease subunit [Methanomassiliicoccus sp.]|nr:DHA2 family efflux MFS transporter permease subunit [Methanomassiliicoccus sp.]